MKEIKRFFGLHFDFHAGNEVEIGVRTCAEDIEAYILEAKPDFIQCDCKGHAGNCSYPTKVPAGKPADKLVSDNLRIWCEVAKKHNIPLFVHYSGVWDGEYVKTHPEQATVYEEKYQFMKAVSMFGDYVHDLLIPQIKELIDEYGIAGCWIDGDCWAVQHDYSERAKAYLRDDMSKRESNEVMRRAYLKYLQTYTDELHAYAPDFKVISNWAYTSYMPEKPSVALDFLSGDYPHNDSVHVARYEGRAIANRGMAWDLMAWGFEWSHWAHKSAVQLMQEASVNLSLGGGFQVYETQNADGSVRRHGFARLKALSEFVRAREFLYGRAPQAQVAILYDGESFYHKSDVFRAAGATNALIGAVNAVLEAQWTANIIFDYQLDSLNDYQTVIVPEWEHMTEATKKALLTYAENGGNLLVVGVEPCKQIGEQMGLTLGEVKTFISLWVKDKDNSFALVNKRTVLDLLKGEGYLYCNIDVRDSVLPSYRVETYGKGQVAFVPFDCCTSYFEFRSFTLRNYFDEIMRVLAKPIVEVNHRHIDITMQPSDEGVYLNLVNMLQGRHAVIYGTYDEVPEIWNVEIKYGKKCKQVRMPLGENFTWESTENGTIVRLEKLEIHSVIEFIE